jgi:N utilization substance protein B
LLKSVAVRDDDLTAQLKGRTPNWEQDRIAVLDMILLKLAIAEFLYFPSIPSKVTINEYLEIAKEYATPKSSTFINGILDVISKDLERDQSADK